MMLELIRGNNPKCPPFLLFGLIVMCFFLLCNWWSLSSQNFELLKQVDNLAEQLRVNGEELGKCSQQQTLLNEKLKDSHTKFVQQQIKIEQIKEMEEDIKTGYEKIQAELNDTQKKCEFSEKKFSMCNADKDSLQKLSESQAHSLEALHTENKHLKFEIDKNNLKIKELEEKLNSTSKKEFSLNNNSPILNQLQTKVKQIQQKNNRKSKTNKNEQQNVNNPKYSDSMQEVEEIKNDDPNFIPSEGYDQREQEMKGS